MLKIKCIENFKTGYTMLVILGDSGDYLHAAKYLANKEEAFLHDPNFVTYYDSDLITKDMLYPY